MLQRVLRAPKGSGPPSDLVHQAHRVAFGSSNPMDEAAGPGQAGWRCPEALLPDGPTCPRCGGERAASGAGGGSWVHGQAEAICGRPTSTDAAPR